MICVSRLNKQIGRQYTVLKGNFNIFPNKKIYRHQTLGFFLTLSNIFSSKGAIKSIAYGGANFVPVAIPRISLQVLSENSKILWGKCLSIKFKNILPIFVLTDLLKGGLN